MEELQGCGRIEEFFFQKAVIGFGGRHIEKQMTEQSQSQISKFLQELTDKRKPIRS